MRRRQVSHRCGCASEREVCWRHRVHLITLAVLEQSAALYLDFGSSVRMRLGGVEEGGRSMSMTHSEPLWTHMRAPSQ